MGSNHLYVKHQWLMRPLTYSNIFVLRWFKSWSWKRTLAKFEGWQVSFFFSKLFSHRFLLKCGNFKLSSKSHPACLQITDCMKPVRWVFFFGKFSEVSWRDIQNYYRTHKFNSFNGRLSLLGWVIQSMPIQPTIHENNARRQTQAHIRSRTQPAGKLSMGHSTPLTTPSPRRFPQNSNCCFPLCNGLRLTFLHLELQI